MQYKALSHIKESIEKYKIIINEVLVGNKTAKDIKPSLGAMGVYEQREKGTFMLRVRVPAGILQVEQLRNMYEIAKIYQVKKLHLTSRQGIQFHGVSLKETGEIMDRLLDYNLITVGSGGNQPRNITCSPLTGVEQGEAFDVLPYSLSSYNHIIRNIHGYNLPRKFKVSFSSTAEDTVNATVADLGFIAFKEDENKYFKVFAGGGLGRNAKEAIVVEEKIPAREALYYVQGAKDLFEAEGDRTNRNKARLRYVAERMGEEEFKKLLRKYVENLKHREDLLLPQYKENIITKKGKRTKRIHRSLYKQKQEGLYSVHIHPKRGYIALDKIHEILSFVQGIDQVEFRLTMNQGFYIINLNGEEADRILDQVEKLKLNPILFEITVCTGSSICQIGIADTEALIHNIHRRFKGISPKVQNALPPIHISGCLNSCAAHQIAEIGLCGKKVRIDGVVKDVYRVFSGGKKDISGAIFGQLVEEVPGEDIPQMLYQIAKNRAKSKI